MSGLNIGTESAAKAALSLPLRPLGELVLGIVSGFSRLRPTGDSLCLRGWFIPLIETLLPRAGSTMSGVPLGSVNASPKFSSPLGPASIDSFASALRGWWSLSSSAALRARWMSLVVARCLA
jgi:hypothetical protein